ncbi:MAG: hypothetical protein H6841_09515 [Planctomycetes bacterium]|nr:hypothetical protein [Planctomycetota bacterium]MCB9936155.1 hypothetical protein [Planctomycetota bacterium]
MALKWATQAATRAQDCAACTLPIAKLLEGDLRVLGSAEEQAAAAGN